MEIHVHYTWRQIAFKACCIKYKVEIDICTQSLIIESNLEADSFCLKMFPVVQYLTHCLASK